MEPASWACVPSGVPRPLSLKLVVDRRPAEISRSPVAGRREQGMPYRCRAGAASRAELARARVVVAPSLKTAGEASNLLMNKGKGMGLEEPALVSRRRAVSEGREGADDPSLAACTKKSEHHRIESLREEEGMCVCCWSAVRLTGLTYAPIRRWKVGESGVQLSPERLLLVAAAMAKGDDDEIF